MKGEKYTPRLLNDKQGHFVEGKILSEYPTRSLVSLILVIDDSNNLSSPI